MGVSLGLQGSCYLRGWITVRILLPDSNFLFFFINADPSNRRGLLSGIFSNRVGTHPPQFSSRSASTLGERNTLSVTVSTLNRPVSILLTAALAYR